MSKRVVIEENTPLKLEERYLKICEELLKENPKQLFRLNNGSLIFDEYIVGALQIDDLTVEIKSRHDIFSLEKIFEMIFFLKTKGYERRMDVLGYKKDSSFGMSQIASSFCKMCEKLIQFGLSGHFNKINKKSKYLRGKIEFRKFNKKVMVLEGLEVNYQYYSLNSFENMLIKAALRKLSASQNNPTLQVKINSLLREFDFIDIYTPTKTELREYKYNSQFSNPHYSMMTEYAIIILDNLNLSFKGGCLTGSSFLINSNMLFENYIFKSLSENLEEQIEKW